MSNLHESGNRILELCWAARQAKGDQRAVIAAELARLHGPDLPYALNSAASDAIFFAICGAEQEGAVPLEDLPKLISATVETYGSKDPGNTSPTAPPAQLDEGGDS